MLGIALQILLVLVVPQAGTQPVPPTPPVARYISPFENVTALECTADADDITNGTKSGIVGDFYRWKEFYVFPDKAFDDDELEAIRIAMYYLWQEIPCVPCGIWAPGSNPTGDYVHITRNNTGCASRIGKLGGRQEMNLQSPGCMQIGTIMHELIHALGFNHEHVRPDRDDYVKIHWHNIKPEANSQFVTHPIYEETFGVPYDQHSIMHYKGKAFSRNGEPTITAKDGGWVGDLGYLRDSDILKLRKMYNCSCSC